MSLIQGGNLLRGLKETVSLNFLPLNCAINLSSVLQNSRMSGMAKSFIANRSKPSPNAQPTFCPAPARWRMFCSTIPQPRTSIHWPFHNISNSQEGCVKGKKTSTQRNWRSVPNKCEARPSRVCFKLCSIILDESTVSHSCLSQVLFPFGSSNNR